MRIAAFHLPSINRRTSSFLWLAITSVIFLPLSNCFAASPSAPMTMPSSNSGRVTTEHLNLAEKCVVFLDKSSDPFHAVQSSVDLLTQAGFVALNDQESYKNQLAPGGKYYFTRNKSTLVAFAVGGAYDAATTGVPSLKIIGGHTDSPNLRVKPRSKRGAAGCIQLGVECYGGGLWNTWFDRDLGISGRVFVRVDGGKVEQKLVKVDRALLRISNLAIHLQTAKEREAFAFNKEDHLSPILAMAAKKALDSGSGDGASDDKKDEKAGKVEDGWTEYQEPALIQLLASELTVEVKDIIDFELSLFDVCKATLGGVFNEFLHSARLDNLASCFIALEALLDHSNSKLDTDKGISMIVLYDHEEVGSGSAVGAAGPIMGDAIRRISAALFGGGSDLSPADAYETTVAKSFCLSSDQAHALHPNYASKHESNHQPKMNQGMVIKRNANQRYATNGVTGLIVREIARRAGLPPVQEFIVRQDCGCGSTIGPLISTAVGVRAIDMGCPQLSMHSIRETMGVCDLKNGVDLFKAFFEHFSDVDESIEQ